jgi:hypothetical protein
MTSRNPGLPLIATFAALLLLGATLLGSGGMSVVSAQAPAPPAPPMVQAVLAPPGTASSATPQQPPPAAPAQAAPPTPVAPPGTIPHVVKRGESLPGIVRQYLSASSFMTAAELEAALRKANGDRQGNALKPGETLIIPGMEGPITEKPIAVPKDYEVRAIYLTGAMAGGEHGLQIIKRWRQVGGNAVVFDAKDSDGIVNVPFQHPLVSATHRPAISNLPKFARFLHQQRLQVIARIAIFRDEYLAQHHSELAVQSRRSGQAWRENGKLVWLDPSRQDVQDYNIALARYVAESGVDEVQFDYVRFPAEGDQKDAKFAFETANPKWTRADVLADFLKDAYAALHPLNVLFSLDVFGVMAWQRPVDLSHTGQDIVRMAKECDVLSPMIYPSHFFGMDGYEWPGDAPEHFIAESMERFRKITEGSGVVLRPWLQAFGWRTRTYSPDYIRTQVVTAREKGGIGFLFWNARNDYGRPFTAMPEMRANQAHYFRGDELPGAAADPARTATGAGKQATSNR